MKTFQDLYDSTLRRREREKAVNPMITWQLGELGIQIYANNPLQFSVMYGDISAWENTHQEMDLHFAESGTSGKKSFSIAIVNPDLAAYGEKKKFQLDEGIEKLAEEFQGVECVWKIANCLLQYPTNG